jgi:hypothetical protein
VNPVHAVNLVVVGLYFVNGHSLSLFSYSYWHLNYLNKNQKNPTHEKPVPATVLPNNLDTKTKTSNCTSKEIYVESIKMSSPSQNITSP